MALPAPNDRDPQVIRRVLDGYKRLSAEIRPKGSADPMMTASAAAKASDAWLAKQAQRASDPAPKLSPDALRSIGIGV